MLSGRLFGPHCGYGELSCTASLLQHSTDCLGLHSFNTRFPLSVGPTGENRTLWSTPETATHTQLQPK